MSCLLLAKLLTSVLNALRRFHSDFSVYCWSDSKIALCWIKGVHKEWETWVENRVIKIRNCVSPTHWYHVPGTSNPADICTRMATKQNLAPDSCWFEGPDFLRRKEGSWPTTDISMNDVTVGLKSVSTKTVSNVAVTDNSGLENILHIKRFSSVTRLIYVLAYVFRFVHNAIATIRNYHKRIDDLTVAEMKDAETLL